MKAEVKQLMKSFEEFSQSSRQEIQDLKNIVDRTYDVVVDTRYKVIEMINVFFYGRSPNKFFRTFSKTREKGYFRQ